MSYSFDTLEDFDFMSYVDTEQEPQEIQLNCYREKMDKLLSQFQKENNITQQTLDDWAGQHERITLMNN